jgi:hypothetical protein
MMVDRDALDSAATLSENYTNDFNRLLVHALFEMAARIKALEEGRGSSDDSDSRFERRVMDVLENRSEEIVELVREDIVEACSDWAEGYEFEEKIERIANEAARDTVDERAEDIVRAGLKDILG